MKRSKQTFTDRRVNENIEGNKGFDINLGDSKNIDNEFESF